MNRDDIIRMAREAGLIHFYDSEGHCTGITDAPLITEDLDRNDSRLVEMLAPFAALVAAAEREACAKLMGELTCMGDAKECFEVAATYIRARGQG
jgi:hypothetical protein